MELKFTIDSEDLWDGEEGYELETLLTDSLRREIMNSAKGKLASEQFKTFSQLVSDSIVADIKVRMENFLSEEIALTEGWGKPTFVGSIEDLIKKRFDDVLLRTVDGAGKTLEGCTSSGTTWIEWSIESKLDRSLKRHLSDAGANLERYIKKEIDAKIVAIKDSAIKEQVDSAFTSILKG